MKIFFALSILFYNFGVMAGAPPPVDIGMNGSPAYYGASQGTQVAAERGALQNEVANTGDGQHQGFIQQCTSNYIMCGFAVITAAQIVMDLNGAKKASNAADLSQCTSAFCASGTVAGDGTTPPPLGGGSSGGSLSPIGQATLDKAENDLKNLAAKGYSYDSSTGTVNTPQGAQAASNYSSSDGLKKMGATDADLKTIAGIIKNASLAGGDFGYDEGGGGGAGSRKAKNSDDKDIDMNAYMKSLLGGPNKGRDVAGLQKRLGGDKIGIAQDNIFQMISRRYENQKPSLVP